MSKKMDINTPWQEITPGGTIYDAGNAREFKTGDWRSVKPIYIKEKCTQCGLCFPVCPDDSIPVNSEQKREDFDYEMCKGCRSMCEGVSFFRYRNEVKRMKKIKYRKIKNLIRI